MKKQTEQPALPMYFFQVPRIANTTMSRSQLRAVLLEYEGRIMACGELWDICSKHLGAGVYRVFLKLSAI